jgi:hypothetical protein
MKRLPKLPVLPKIAESEKQRANPSKCERDPKGPEGVYGATPLKGTLLRSAFFSDDASAPRLAIPSKPWRCRALFCDTLRRSEESAPLIFRAPRDRSGAGPSPLSSPGLAVGIRDSRPRRMKCSFQNHSGRNRVTVRHSGQTTN